MSLRGGRWLASLLLLLLVSSGLGFWIWFVPNWRPPLRGGEEYGVDVSHHQGRIDWQAVAEDGISFAYVKASEGGDLVDPRFDENWQEAEDAGLDRGAYHFFTLCRAGDVQARWFVSVAQPDDRALPPAVDLELIGNCSRRPSAAAVNAELAEFLRIVEDAWGRRALLYVGDGYEQRYPIPNRLDRRRWQLRFLIRPNTDEWAIWQVHGYAHVEGIRGDVDLDVGRLAMTSGSAKSDGYSTSRAITTVHR